MNVTEVHELLAGVGYCSNSETDIAVSTAIALRRPLLLEGAPGTGKTSLAKALADGMGCEFIRVQMYEGITEDRFLVDFNYPKQLLSLEAIKPSLYERYRNMDPNEALSAVGRDLNFYTKEFMIERPIARSINGDGKKVLLIDEIDKAPESVESFIYEFTENLEFTSPEFGKFSCPDELKPIVVITSNGYRNLSEPLKRRCAYLYLNRKNKAEMVEILMKKAEVSEKIAEGIAVCFEAMEESELKHTPSISEGIDWAKVLKSGTEITKDMVLGTLCWLVKDFRDEDTIKEIVSKKGEILWRS